MKKKSNYNKYTLKIIFEYHFPKQIVAAPVELFSPSFVFDPGSI